MELSLVILAGGLGSRFGGIKQIEPVGPDDSIIMSYSIYDAINAGFNKIVFVIREDFEAEFKERIVDRISHLVECVCVYQKLDDIPNGYSVPDARSKPWGTGHAMWAARNVLNGPFAVINADDFYGREAFELLAKHLTSDKLLVNKEYCMVAYNVSNTLSEIGTVSRGICEKDENNYLSSVRERSSISERNGNVFFLEDGIEYSLKSNQDVSMNCWGFDTNILNNTEEIFVDLLNNDDFTANPKSELYITLPVNKYIKKENGKVLVMSTKEKWFGFTYLEDKENVISSIKNMIDLGVYPEKLFV